MDTNTDKLYITDGFYGAVLAADISTGYTTLFAGTGTVNSAFASPVGRTNALTTSLPQYPSGITGDDNGNALYRFIQHQTGLSKEGDVISSPPRPQPHLVPLLPHIYPYSMVVFLK